MPNQHKSLPPIEEIEPYIREYHGNLSIEKMAEALKAHYDTEKYGLSATTLKRKILPILGLESTKKQGHTVESITPSMIDLRTRYPNAGYREIKNILASDYNMRVSRDVVQNWCQINEPGVAASRMAKRFQRRIFYSAGVNHIWSFDQHDKWKAFGLRMHVGLDVYSRKMLWLKIWWNNSNPRLICSYYLEACKEIYGLPLLTQSDLGSENFGIANAQTAMRQELDKTLVGTLQHKWSRGHNNIKSEIMWSQIRSRFSVGFEEILKEGELTAFFDQNNYLHILVFRWLGIPWLQAELDRFRERYNKSRPRLNTKVVSPAAAPTLLFKRPDMYDAHDFKVIVDANMLEEARASWAPPSHPVFLLVPEIFDEIATKAYSRLNKPVLTSHTFWDIFKGLLDAVQNISDDNTLENIQSQFDDSMERADEEIDLLEGQRDWNMEDVLGGEEDIMRRVDDGDELDEEEMVYAIFSSDEDDDMPDI